MYPILRRLSLKCAGAMWREGCVQPGWEGFGMLIGPSAPLPDFGELVATGVCQTCRATATLRAALLWGAHSGAASGPPGPSTGDVSGHLPSTLSSQRFLFSSGGCMPSSLEPRPAPSFLQPLSASAPGQLWANSPWHFPSGDQPLQPGTLVSGLQHALGEFGLELFALGCWRALDFVCSSQSTL